MRKLVYLLALSALLITTSCEQTPSDNTDPTPNPPAEETYKVGDFYQKGLAKGVVVAVNENGTSGLLISLDESEQMWSTENTILLNEYITVSEDDGQINCEAIKAGKEDWATLYPAVAWCSKKNTGALNSWYLPAIAELRRVYDNVLANMDSVNASLVENGGMPLSFESGSIYWSSTDMTYYDAYSVNFGGGEIYDNETIGYGSPKQDKHNVRCIRKF